MTKPSRPSRNGSAKSQGNARAETRGGELERRIARIEFAEGALTRLRVPVPAYGDDARREILTDIDVMSIDVDLRLRLTRSSAECKSGRGQSGEPQNIIWLAGFRQLLDLDRVTIVRPSISTRGRQLARRLDVGTLDETTLRQREQAHSWLPQRFGHLDGPQCTESEAETDKQLRGLPSIPGALTQFLRSDALLSPPSALLAGVQAFGVAVTEQGALPEPASTVLSGHALIAVLLAAIQDAATLDIRTSRELRNMLEDEIQASDSTIIPVLERADELMRHVAKRIHRSYTAAGAEPISVNIPSMQKAILAPLPYLDDYVDLVERIRANPTIARDLLQTAELICFEFFLGGSAWQTPAFGHLFTAEHKGLLLVAHRCLGMIAGQQVASYISRIHDVPVYPGSAEVPNRRADSPNTQRAQAEASNDDLDHPIAGLESL